MYTPKQSSKSFTLHRAIIQSGDPVTGITQVKIPDLLGDQVVDVDWMGLEKVGGLYQLPPANDLSLVAVSNDGTQILWVLSADHSAIWNTVQASQTDIGALQSSVTIIASGVVTHTADIATLNTAVSTINSNISTLDGQVVKTITGTANRITATRTGASVSLTTPQDIHTGATPSFAALTTTSGAVTTGTNFVVPATGYMTNPGGNYFRPSDGTNMVIYNGSGATLIYGPSHSFKNVAGTDLATITSGGNVNATGGYQNNGTPVQTLVYSGLAATTSASITSTTSSDIAGATLAPTLAVNDVVVVTAVFEVICTTFTTSTTFVGELSFDGTTQTAVAVFRATAANQRVSVMQQWRIVASAAKPTTIKLRGRLGTGTAGTMDLAANNTTILVQAFR